MGKKQHQKDKLYLTATEWKTLYGGKRPDGPYKSDFKRLPFHCCSLSMQPFEHPYCTKEGVIFDLTSILPFLKKYGLNPVTGEKITAKELTKLAFHKNSAGKYHCPVTFRVFNENTHIVAVQPTGNVFSYDAVERLNIKPSFWRDLITDEPFVRKDLITIQDPTQLEKFNISNFYHLKKNLKLTDEDEIAARKDPRYKLKTMAAETKDILDTLDKEYKPAEKVVNEKKRADTLNAAHYSTGRVAASFTSTAMDPETEHHAAIIDEDIIRYKRVKKKAYVRLLTNLGMLNLELHSDMVPKTCENFLKLCEKGYYNDTILHRSIRNFMIQGGDPTGTGTGGESIWGKPFKDELKPNLTHTGRGVLSMANTGPNTNKSQFFITYRSAKHLDGKHTVFGRVVGGMETIDSMEAVETDAKDKPLEDITIKASQVFVNPYDEADEMVKKERDMATEHEREKKAAESKPKVTVKSTGPRVFREGIGKFINIAAQKSTIRDDDSEEPAVKKKKVKSSLEDFSAW